MVTSLHPVLLTKQQATALLGLLKVQVKRFHEHGLGDQPEVQQLAEVTELLEVTYGLEPDWHEVA